MLIGRLIIHEEVLCYLYYPFGWEGRPWGRDKGLALFAPHSTLLHSASFVSWL